MDRLALEPAIGGIPYLAIYMSCNLDHVLYNKLNSHDSDKRKDSLAFALKYRNDIEHSSHSSMTQISRWRVIVGKRGNTSDRVLIP
mgnify:CR=1 FL=1